MKSLIRGAVRALGYDIVRHQPKEDFPPDITPNDRTILQKVAGYSATTVERQAGLIQAVRYLARRGIEGCFVECGVWRGGSSMISALTLAQEGDTGRELYLYDTFEGMTPPTDADRTTDGILAQTHLEQGKGYWCIAGLEDVKQNMALTGYPQERLHFIKGPVEVTIPAQSPPGPIALLRLDTDWYESTKHELIHLFPLLCDGGILVIDDFGHWEGARKAVEEFMAGLPKPYLLHRMDYTGRLLMKQ
jgi:O-methyltransferase